MNYTRESQQTAIDLREIPQGFENNTIESNASEPVFKLMGEKSCIKINRRDGECFTWEIFNIETHEIQDGRMKLALTVDRIDKHRRYPDFRTLTLELNR